MFANRCLTRISKDVRFPRTFPFYYSFGSNICFEFSRHCEREVSPVSYTLLLPLLHIKCIQKIVPLLFQLFLLIFLPCYNYYRTKFYSQDKNSSRRLLAFLSHPCPIGQPRLVFHVGKAERTVSLQFKDTSDVHVALS